MSSLTDNTAAGKVAEEASKLIQRVNALLIGQDVDVALAVITKLLAAYLLTLPANERENELHSIMRLVRAFAKMGGRLNG